MGDTSWRTLQTAHEGCHTGPHFIPWDDFTHSFPFTLVLSVSLALLWPDNCNPMLSIAKTKGKLPFIQSLAYLRRLRNTHSGGKDFVSADKDNPSERAEALQSQISKCTALSCPFYNIFKTAFWHYRQNLCCMEKRNWVEITFPPNDIWNQRRDLCLHVRADMCMCYPFCLFIPHGWKGMCWGLRPTELQHKASLHIQLTAWVLDGAWPHHTLLINDYGDIGIKIFTDLRVCGLASTQTATVSVHYTHTQNTVCLFSPRGPQY